MPLKKGYSRKSTGANTKTDMKAKKSRKQVAEKTANLSKPLKRKRK